MNLCGTCGHEKICHRAPAYWPNNNSHCERCCDYPANAGTSVCSHKFVEQPVDTRPNWDEYFRAIAAVVATRASCPRASIGAVIVSGENRILSTGYNGAPSGESHCITEGCQIEDGHCQRVLHAEVNAIAHAARAGISVEGAKIYVSGLPPCRECMKVIKAAGLEVA